MNDKYIDMEMVSDNEDYDKTKLQIDMEKAKEYFKANTTMLLSMLSLLLYATFNSIVISVIFRRIVFRN